MNKQSLVITKKEQDILKKYLQESNLTDFNKTNLLSELASARVVKTDELPDDAIGLNTVVHVKERQSRQSFIFQIVLPASADVKKNKVSAFAPIAIALLGYRTGSTTKWEMPAGVQEFEIIKVTRVELEQQLE